MFQNISQLCDSKYNTTHGNSNSVLFIVPQFVPSIYKSRKQYGLTFSFDAPKIWNDLPAEVRSVSSLHSFHKKLKSYFFCKSLSSIVPLNSVVFTVQTLLVKWTIGFSLRIGFVALRVLFWRLSTIKVLDYIRFKQNTLQL